MKTLKLQNMRALRDEMKAVARGERRAAKDAALPSFDSATAVMHLLTPANRKLLAIIRDEKPDSVATLARLTGRAQPNLTRALAKLQSAGFVAMEAHGRRKVPVARARKFIIEIDPYAQRDRLKLA